MHVKPYLYRTLAVAPQTQLTASRPGGHGPRQTYKTRVYHRTTVEHTIQKKIDPNTCTKYFYFYLSRTEATFSTFSQHTSRWRTGRSRVCCCCSTNLAPAHSRAAQPRREGRRSGSCVLAVGGRQSARVGAAASAAELAPRVPYEEGRPTIRPSTSNEQKNAPCQLKPEQGCTRWPSIEHHDDGVQPPRGRHSLSCCLRLL